MPEETEVILHTYAYSCYNHALWEKAIATFRYLTLYFPNKSNYWYGLGSSLMLSGNDDEAAHAFQIASIHSPEDPRPLTYWAECLARLGRSDMAQAAIKQAEKKALNSEFTSFLDQLQVIKERIVEVNHANR